MSTSHILEMGIFLNSDFGTNPFIRKYEKIITAVTTENATGTLNSIINLFMFVFFSNR